MVDEHAVADPGARVDLNSGEGSTELAEATGDQLQRQVAGPEPVADAVQTDGLESGVAAHNFQPSTGSRITLADDREVGADVIKHRKGGSAGGGRCLQANVLTEQVDRIGAEVTLGAMHLWHPHQLGAVLAQTLLHQGKARTIAEHVAGGPQQGQQPTSCLLYTSPSPRDRTRSRMPSSA